MTKAWTIRLACAGYFGATVTVEAETLEEAIPAAIRYADDNERWKDTDHVADPFCVAACQGADARSVERRDLGPDPRPLHRARRATRRHGDRPDEARGIEVARGRVLLRFRDDAGTVTAEVTDPPHPPANKPHVTVSLDARGKPHAEVRHGRAVVRILDR